MVNGCCHSKCLISIMPSSSALIPMSICTLQCLFSHSFTTYEWLNSDCDVQIYIGITSRWTGYKEDTSNFISLQLKSMPSSSALIPMSSCTLQCLFSHSFTTYEWLNRDCDAQIYIGITSRWTGYMSNETSVVIESDRLYHMYCPK
jgi:hypothetical protein